jgi:hypothetical protein
MPDLLSDEELLALEEELLAREQGPITAPVQAPQILPPGPSVEFLRRQRELTPTSLPEAPEGWGRGVVDTFNPRTGVREEFSTISPPQRDSDYMEQIRNQINATQFKTQADALNAATQFQHMREFQRLTASGVPAEQALLKTGAGMFSKNPNVIAPLINATRPTMAPTVQDVNGVKVLRSGLRGERATAIRPEPSPKTIAPRVVVGADEFGEPKVTWSGSPEDFAKQFPGATLKGPETKETPKAPEKKQAQTNEVIRITKDGRRAVFNSYTKEFIRYAD